MSGSESSKRPLSLTMALCQQPQSQAPPPPSQTQNMQLSLGTGGGRGALYKPAVSAPPHLRHLQRNSAGVSPVSPVFNMNLPPVITESVPVKKRRGRPRKYRPEEASGSGVSLSMVTGAPTFALTQPSSVGGRVKKMRGRASASTSSSQILHDVNIQSSSQSLNNVNIQPQPQPQPNPLGTIPLVAASTEIGFKPQFLTVAAGEDIIAKMIAIAQNGPRAVCVMSANGVISNVTLCKLATTGGTVTYEGSYDILSLSGSFHLLELNGRRSQSGCLSVSLSSPDGNVFGGNVAGPFITATPVQMVIGTFIPDGQQEPNQHVEQKAVSSPPTQAVMTPSSSQSRPTMGESSCGVKGTSPPNESTGAPHVIQLPWK